VLAPGRPWCQGVGRGLTPPPPPAHLLRRRYVTPGAFLESAEWFGMPRDIAARNWDGCIQARAALYLPGGKIARELSRNPTVLVVNDTAFAHGGLLPAHGGCLTKQCAPAP